MHMDEVREWNSRRFNPEPIDLCPICSSFLGNNMFTHMRDVHGVRHRFLDVRRPPSLQYTCMCGTPFAVYRHMREHVRDNGLNCYHVYLLAGGDDEDDKW